MLLLHIADIHFREPDCLHPEMDPDRTYRTLLLADVRRHVAQLGPIGAILVGGDIAYKGHPKEFETARTWLAALTEAASCPLARVFVVPGNHDVDRAVTERNPSVRNAQNAIARANDTHRERELRTQFLDAETSRALLLPLEAYNDFAKYFNCQVFSPDRLYWKQDLPIDAHLRLRLHGLTSVLLSGREGQDDTRESLYLSPLQTVLEPVDDVINAVMIHHPPDWLMDQEDANDAICGRAMLHFFGHKHRQRITQERNFIRFSAGAVNPDRREAGWLPGYNLVEVTVSGAGAQRRLDVRSHLMQYQFQPERFRHVVTRDNEDVFIDSFPIPTRPVSMLSTSSVAPEPREADAAAEVEVAMSAIDTRNLVYRFWQLTSSQRREIASAMGLLENSEMKLPEPERYGRALLRAGERQLLDRLAQEVAQRERH